jgi:hypothetical protein
VSLSQQPEQPHALAHLLPPIPWCRSAARHPSL